MKGFKGTDKNGKCRGFQYEENHDYEFESAELCKSGGHFCTFPLDVFKYYPPGKECRYFAVESADEDISSEKSADDSKRVTKKLHIGEEIGIEGLIKEHINFVNKNIDVHIKHGDLDTAIAGNHGAATAGYRSRAVAGNHGVATAGEYSAATVGCYGVATAGESGVATAGKYGVATASYDSVTTAGDYSVAMSGDYGTATAGNYSAAIAGMFGTVTAGDYSMATAGASGMATAGYKGTAITGDCGVATANKFGIAIVGDCGVASAGIHGTATTGDAGAATAGNFGTAKAGKGGTATAGEDGIAIADKEGVAASRGKSSVGVNGSALARGIGAKVRGGLGSILVLVEEDCDGSIEDWRAFVVDGNNYKPNVWYQLEDGKVVKVQEEDEQKNYRGLRSE